MASASMRSLYKGKIKESSSSTSNRRRSKGLERKKNRDDEVNKRRLISDDMSPLAEDHDDQVEEPRAKSIPHQKATTRQERLQLWREERKRKMEEGKKNNKKPQFKVSGFHHSTEVELYKREKPKEIKPGSVNLQSKAKPIKSSVPANNQAPVKPAIASKDSRKAASLTSNASTQPSGSTRTTRSSARTAAAALSKSARPGATATIKPTPAQAILPGQPTIKNTRQRGQGTNLYTKLTASAAAKAKTNLEKPKEFLRAKSRTTVKISAPVTRQRKIGPENGNQFMKDKKDKVIAKSQGDVLETGEEEHEDIEKKVYEDTGKDKHESTDKEEHENTEKETSGEPEEESSGNSSDKELHLSDSHVSTPKHSTPAARKSSSRKTKVNSDQIVRDRTDNADSENVTTSASKPTGRQRRSRAASRRSSRNLSVIQVSDVQAAMKMAFEPSWLNTFAPVVENNAESEMPEENSINKRELFIFKGSSSEEEMAEKMEDQPVRRKSSRRSSVVAVNQADENAENDPLETSNKENVLVKDKGLRDKILRKSASEQRKSLSNSSASKRLSNKTISENEDVQNTNENELEQTTTPVKSGRKSRTSTVSSLSRRRSRRLVFSTDDEIEESGPTPNKRTRRSIIQPKLGDDDEENFVQREREIDDTQAAETEPMTPVSQQRVRMGSAMAKRRSARIAALTTSCTEETATIESETELTLKTPKNKRKSMRKRSCSTACQKRQSTIVSVSDEGTTDVEGDCVVENIRATPRLDQSKLIVSPPSHSKLSSSRRSIRRSEVIDVSDEGTALVEEEDPASSIVYHVTKPADNEACERVLQELDVQKMDGEVSFIEVLIDDSMDTTEIPSDSSAKKESMDPAISSNDHDVQTISDDNNHSTQPFTPRRSHEMSKMNTSSTQSSLTSNKSRKSAIANTVQTPSTLSSPHQDLPVLTTPGSTHSQKGAAVQSSPAFEDPPVMATPRSNRQRGQSMVPSAFKTPGQPLSALRTRSVKRRKTEHSSPSRSPEEMIEILKRSPMIEMTRRRSRLAASPAPAPNSLNFDAVITDSALEQTTSNSSAVPDLSNSLHNLSEPGLVQNTEAVAVVDISSPCPTDKVTLKPEVAERVKYFRDLLVSETDRLNVQCDKWNEISSATPALEEEVLGQIRSTVGKAQLLMDQRFKQFSGLVDNCEFGLGEKETTPTDLQGFWEMIYFQVEDVDHLFADLSKLQENKWEVKMPSPEKKILKTKKAAVKVSKPKVKSNFAAFREELMKRKAQAKVKAPVATSSAEATKVFDAGFFKVTSPVRSPAGKRLSNTPLKQPASEESSVVDKNAKENFTQVTSRSSTDSPSTPAGLGNKENEIKSTPNNGRLMSMSGKRLSYVPVVPSPLLNDITGISSKKKS